MKQQTNFSLYPKLPNVECNQEHKLKIVKEIQNKLEFEYDTNMILYKSCDHKINIAEGIEIFLIFIISILTTVLIAKDSNMNYILEYIILICGILTCIVIIKRSSIREKLIKHNKITELANHKLNTIKKLITETPINENEFNLILKC